MNVKYNLIFDFCMKKNNIRNIFADLTVYFNFSTIILYNIKHALFNTPITLYTQNVIIFMAGS